MQITGNDLIAAFEQFAPPSLAIPHDPIGIQIGDGNRVIHTVLVTLDVRPAVVEEAVALHADMIFAHHPVVFHPAKNLNYADPQHALYAELIRQNILVYAAHTNYDRASGGMNDVLATTLGLADVQPLSRMVRAPTWDALGNCRPQCHWRHLLTKSNSNLS